jgi:hypothetical protein
VTGAVRGGRSFVLLPSKGAAYLHLLLTSQNTRISAAELAYQAAGTPHRFALGDAGETLDDDAVTASRARAEGLLERRAEAERNHDSATVERLQTGITLLTERIQKPIGLRGRKR